jgi:transcriptional regulator with XRE-family HTH domain
MGFKEIGRKIQAAREERGMTQVDLAQALGITQAALSNYELGKRRLYLHQIEQIANILGKRLDYFMSNGHDSSLPQCPDRKNDSLEGIVERIGALDSQEILSLREFLDYLEWRRNHVSLKR